MITFPGLQALKERGSCEGERSRSCWKDEWVHWKPRWEDPWGDTQCCSHRWKAKENNPKELESIREPERMRKRSLWSQLSHNEIFQECMIHPDLYWKKKHTWQHEMFPWWYHDWNKCTYFLGSVLMLQRSLWKRKTLTTQIASAFSLMRILMIYIMSGENLEAKMTTEHLIEVDRC